MEIKNAELTEQVRAVTDRVAEQWTTEVLNEEDIPEATREAINALLRETQAGHAGLCAQLLADHAAYLLLVELGLDRLGTQDMTVAHEGSTEPYFASMALSWVASAARGTNDYLFATMMMGLAQNEAMNNALIALLDLIASLREGKATVTLTEGDPDAENEIVTTVVEPLAAGE